MTWLVIQRSAATTERSVGDKDSIAGKISPVCSSGFCGLDFGGVAYDWDSNRRESYRSRQQLELSNSTTRTLAFT